LSQAQLAELFEKDRDTIGLHLKNIFKEGELDKEETTEESSVVRQAVATSHTDPSIWIWKSIADGLIDQVKPSAYKDSAKYLRRIRTVYESSGREGDWRELVKELRTRHNRKRRLTEVLDRLEAN
jgi:uncharacterized Zn finger protein